MTTHLYDGQGHVLRALMIAAAVIELALIATPIAQTVLAGAKGFVTPEDAVEALKRAVSPIDDNALRTIFGPDLDSIENPDRVQATNEFTSFAAALNADCRIVLEGDSKCTLELGADRWPFPIPLVRQGQQ